MTFSKAYTIIIYLRNKQVIVLIYKQTKQYKVHILYVAVFSFFYEQIFLKSKCSYDLKIVNSLEEIDLRSNSSIEINFLYIYNFLAFSLIGIVFCFLIENYDKRIQ